MKNVVIWSKQGCYFCDSAKLLCDDYGIAFEERVVGDDYTREQLLEAVPGARTVPQIFIGDQLVGGYQEFREYLLTNRSDT